MLTRHSPILHLICICWLTTCVAADDAAQSPDDTLAKLNGTTSRSGFSVTEDDHGVTVLVDGKLFAKYVVDDINKPYLWPVIGPTGKAMTRAYPMVEVESEGKSQRDHPHHRGITFGHESVEGEDGSDGDTWHEWITFGGLRQGPGDNPKNNKRLAIVGRIVHQDFTEIGANADHAVVAEVCDHVDPTGKRLLTEERRMTFRTQPGSRLIDFDQVFIASEGEVRFNDRKDAGLSIRVPSSMALVSDQGGKIINSEGDVDDDTWSRAAKWCDYHGPVEGEHLGIAFFNHPSSYRFPTRWHVRGYGLFTANPFASKSYDKSLPDGTTVLKPGEKLKLSHRILFHSGDPVAAGIEDAWTEYAQTTRP
ncbi:DUF6807 domain-containing protein [Aporhodopirellula aestuarii]|uniref:PmoA family protein n=1 Tax=Aporhodopirellula aestuarii TaxID=2950107 RepID=A0ABT0U065_9BACT|nr:PmoA family protein [Aporhodopirellula aestuarii]MCM2370220.1 PmoA family protein [Aporhodopirellula aestuarii]